MSYRWKLYLVPWLGFVVALSMHLWHLNQPPTIVSDEVSFVRDGWDYVTGQSYFDPHPPLGKEQLGAVFTYFGYQPFTWRILNAVEGALIVPLLWWLLWRLTRSRVAANVAVIFTLLDGFLLTESRLGLINVPYILYSLAALVCVLKATEWRRPGRWLLFAGVMIGAAASVKWLALTMIVPTMALWFWPQFFGQKKNTEQPKWIWPVAIGSLIFLPLVIYWLVFRIHFAWLGTTDTFFQTNIKMLNYNLSVPAIGDPYGQPWWGWLAMWQPFLYWSQAIGQKISVIWSMPNPWLWWTGALALIYSLFRGWRLPATRLLNILLLTTWLPFVGIQRIMYSYHAMPFGLFLIVLLAIFSAQLWSRYRRYVIGYVVVAVAVFLWFLPWYMNIPLSAPQHKLRQWLPGWKVTIPANATTRDG